MILSVASSQSVCERREASVTLAHRAVFDCGGPVTLCGMNLTTLRKTTHLPSVCSVHVFQLHSRLHRFSTVCVFFQPVLFSWAKLIYFIFKIMQDNHTEFNDFKVTLTEEEFIKEKRQTRVLVYIPL